jgi:membrane-bound lytic murein transglycosylase D
MTLTEILTNYITLNILIVSGSLSLMFYPILMGLAKRVVRSNSLLRIHYTVLSTLIIVILIYPVFPEKEIFSPPVKIWSAQPIKASGAEYSSNDNRGYIDLSGFTGAKSIDADRVKIAVISLICSLLLLGLIKLSYDLYRLFTIRSKSYLIRKLGSVSIYANDMINVPFSYWLPGTANIIIPTEMLRRRPDYRITLLHELQHHRNGDTKWIYFLWFLKSICIFNPFIHLWSHLISELQEFTCDEVLVDRKKIDSQDYARCLFEAAKSASYHKHVSVCATGLMFMVERKLLKRRIEKMLGKIPVQLKWQMNLLVMILVMGMMISIAFASKGSIRDRRITEAQAISMAEKASADTDFPVMINDVVLKELNTYLGTPEGREFIKASLKRMKNYRKGIEEKINEYGVPMEFLAIPLIESGYRNLDETKNKVRCAGIWQFIPSTARAFGLRVDNEVDERLNVDILTDAAMRYLLSNKLRFNDWQLAVLAYNLGERNVQKTIEKIGSRDVWDVARAYYNNKYYNKYYAKFMAAIIIMKNLDSIN